MHGESIPIVENNYFIFICLSLYNRKMKFSTHTLRLVMIIASLYIGVLSAAEHALPLTEKAAAQLIANESGDKVLSTSVDKNDETQFRVKTLSEQGHIKTYRVDSVTGQILD